MRALPFVLLLGLSTLLAFTILPALDVPEYITAPVKFVTCVLVWPGLYLSRMSYLNWSVKDAIKYITPFSNYDKTRELFFGRRRSVD